jgi:hypothetical protein
MTTATKKDKMNSFGHPGKMIKEPHFRIETDLTREVWGAFADGVKHADEILLRLGKSTHNTLTEVKPYFLNNLDAKVIVEPIEGTRYEDAPSYEFTIRDLLKLSHTSNKNFKGHIRRNDIDIDLDLDEDLDIEDFQTD